MHVLLSLVAFLVLLCAATPASAARLASGSSSTCVHDACIDAHAKSAPQRAKSYLRARTRVGPWLTGKEEDIEVGLAYFGARYYAPYLGRFASADPLTIHGLGADLNPYAYVRGRVMTDIDPFGLDGEEREEPQPNPDGDVVVRGHPRPNDGTHNLAMAEDHAMSRAHYLGSLLAMTLSPGFTEAFRLGESLRNGTFHWRTFGTLSDAGHGLTQGILDNHVLISELTGVQAPRGDSALYELARAAPGLVVLGLGFGANGGSTPPSSAAEGGVGAFGGGAGPRAYSVAFETTLPEGSLVGSRGAHFAQANEALYNAMQQSPEFAGSMRQLGVEMAPGARGAFPRTPPPGWTWHHELEPGVMRLVPRAQHTLGSPWWYLLHPGGQGGYSIWGQ